MVKTWARHKTTETVLNKDGRLTAVRGLVVGVVGGWRLVAVGGGQLVAVGSWRLAIHGDCP